MRYIVSIIFFLLLASVSVIAQQPAVKPLRIADTLTPQEKTNRNAVILRSEVDSLIQQWVSNQPPQQAVKEPEVQKAEQTSPYILWGLIAIVGLLVLVIFLFYRHQQKMVDAIAELKEKAPRPEATGNPSVTGMKEKKTKSSPQALEGRITDLHEELNKLSKENEGLNRVIKEYNGIQHEFDSLKHRILKSYKVRNYPGYDKNKDEIIAMQGVLETENSVATYAYEKFLKPILSITDANKNSPSKMNAADREKLIDLLLSLSLLYIEYLYLRVNDLSIGGKMVERIQAVTKGKSPDTALLKQLNVDFGSRALVIKIALEKIGLQKLSYPVFDETNLNNQ